MHDVHERSSELSLKREKRCEEWDKNLGILQMIKWSEEEEEEEFWKFHWETEIKRQAAVTEEAAALFFQFGSRVK